jgi:prolyl-tRNA editing enzyme YbaK/EbsC (Cys-tRNA(Pro) deacylase)
METCVTKFLDEKGIEYKVLPHKVPVFTCEDAARERGVVLNEMVKCMLIKDSKGSFTLALIQGDKKVNLGELSKIVKSEVKLASSSDIENVLGYRMGAIPPLLLKTPVLIIMDEDITRKEKVNISSGDPSAGLELKTKDMLSVLANCRVHKISA